MKKKGFTLVELLIVIVILGIITGISIPLIRNIREKNQNKEYSNYIESMEYSAKLYMDSHKEDLFVIDGDESCAIIEYDELEKKGLLKDIGIDNVSCKSSNTFVAVEKKGNEYIYKVSLQCTSNGETVYTKEGINRDDCKESSEIPIVTLSSQNNIAPTQVGILTIRDSDDGIAGYYFGKSNPKQTTVAYTEVVGRPHELVINDIEITEAGTYYLVAKDAAGNRSQVISKSVYQTTLDADGGVIEPSSILTLQGDSFTPPTPTKEGFVFEGWYEEESYTNRVDGTYSPTGNKTLYAKWRLDTYTYTIRYVTNGGTLGDSSPTLAESNEIITLSSPTKVFTVNIDANSQGAVARVDGEAVTSVSSAQYFNGWQGSNVDEVKAVYGTAPNALTSAWNNSMVKIGAGNEVMYLQNIGRKDEETVLTATWNSSSITLPTLTRSGSACNYNTAADGSGETYESGALYVPSITEGNDTLYARCIYVKTPATMTLSSTSGSLTYGTNGTVTITTDGDGALSCSSSNTAVATCSISGTTLTIVPQANTADNKTATITITQAEGENYTGTSVAYTATVNRRTLTCPSSPSAKTYSGSSQASGVTCPTGSTAGGDTSGTAAGTYTQTCTATAGNKFSSACSVSWTINKKATTMSLSSTSGTIDCDDYKTITVTTNGDGTLSCTTSKSSVATCSVLSGNRVRIYGEGRGTATITIKQSAGTNYAAASKTYSATGRSCGSSGISWTYYYYWGDTASCTTAAYCHDPCEYHGYSYWSCTSGETPTAAYQRSGAYCYCG